MTPINPERATTLKPAQRPLSADSVEKLLHMSFAHVLEGASPLAPDEIIDPGSICEVEFSISARRRADIEFFNRIGRMQSLESLAECQLQAGSSHSVLGEFHQPKGWQAPLL